MTIEKKDKCENRIDSKMESTICTIKDLFRKDWFDNSEDDCLNTYGLSFDYVEYGTFAGMKNDYYRWQLCWGGPAEEFRFFQNGTIEYWLMDWFDGACRELSGDDLLLFEQIRDEFFYGSIEWDSDWEQAEGQD